MSKNLLNGALAAAGASPSLAPLAAAGSAASCVATFGAAGTIGPSGHLPANDTAAPPSGAASALRRGQGAVSGPTAEAPRLTLQGALRWATRLASLAACLLAWQWASTRHLDLGLLTFQNVPAPSEVALAGWDLLSSPKLAGHLKASLWRVFSGFALAAVAGILAGLLIGRSRRLEDLLMPPLEMLRPIPAVAWIPLAILMFPSSELSMIFITFTGALFPILLNTVHGVENIDARLVASARSLGGGRIAVFTEVVLPGALPSIVTGLAIGMGTAWFCLVTAEMISGQFGIGYYTWAAYTIQNYADIVVGMLTIGLLGMGSSVLVKQLGQALMPWHRQEDKA